MVSSILPFFTLATWLGTREKILVNMENMQEEDEAMRIQKLKFDVLVLLETNQKGREGAVELLACVFFRFPRYIMLFRVVRKWEWLSILLSSILVSPSAYVETNQTEWENWIRKERIRLSDMKTSEGAESVSGWTG